MKRRIFSPDFAFAIALFLLIAGVTNPRMLNAQNAPVTTLSSVSACPGAAVPVLATVTGFTNISGMTLFVTYNSANMTFVSGSGNSALPTFLMTLPQAIGSGMMMITITFNKLDGGGITLADNSTLFTCNFSYIGGNSPFTFLNSGDYSCEYTRGLDVLVDDPASSFYFNGGITPKPLPPAGTITGPAEVIPRAQGLIYSTPSLANAVSYTWTLPAGFSIVSGAGTNAITVDVSLSAISGNVAVKGVNSCGLSGPEAVYAVQVAKQLSVTYYPEGLFNGTGLNKAQGASGDQFPGTTADKVTVKLHDPTDYSTIVYTLTDVDLTVGGQVVASIPAAYNGNYTISVHHRNTIEIASSAAVAFNSGTVSYNFTDAATKVYGNNLKPAGSAFVAYGGDVNQDGVIDGLDMVAVDNQAALETTGYAPFDINGDGLVSLTDVEFVADNAGVFARKVIP